LGLVGESGSGKTTLAWSILGLVRPDAGSRILLDGEPAASALSTRNQAQVKSIQIVFQNPDAALNRSHSVRRMIGRTISKLTSLAKEARHRRIEELARAVRLGDPSLGGKPRQLSGAREQAGAHA